MKTCLHFANTRRLEILGLARLFLALSLGVGCSCLCQSATNTYRFNYASRSALLSDGWNFVATNPNGTARNTEVTNPANGAVVSYDQTAHPGSLQVPVDVGDLWSTANNTRNSLFRSLPSNWTSLRLQVSLAPTVNYEQANLVLYQDDDNYVSVAHSYSGGETIGLSREFSGFPRTVGLTAISAANLYFRLDRDLSTENISGFYSVDGTNWALLGTVGQALVNPRVCLWAGGSGVPWTNGLAAANFKQLDIITSDTYTAPRPTLLVQPQHLVFNGVAGQPLTNWQQLNVVLARGQDPSVLWTLTNGSSWILSDVAGGNTPTPCHLSVNTAGLAPGIYQSVLTCGAPGATSAVANVTLILNPPGRAKMATWKGAKSGAMTLCVDDSYGTAFDDLSTNGLSGTYFGVGYSAPSFYSNYFQAGMELGAHTVDHPCYNELSEPFLRFEIEVNLTGLCASGGQPCPDYISFAWPCGTTSPKMESITADYFLSSRGYNLNQLEDPSPSDFMNLKSFNTHGDPVEPPVADFKRMVDAAISQGKWLNMVLHGILVDDGAIQYSVGKDIWSASSGSVVKYILQRDRTVITNYSETAGQISFSYYRLPLDASTKRSFETAIHPQDTLTLQVDITGLPVIYGFAVNGVATSYTTKAVGARTFLLWDSDVSSSPQAITIQGPTNTAPTLPVQSDLSVNELTSLTVTNTASDPDAGQTLSYSLIGAPGSAHIDTNGVISWNINEGQGPGTYVLTTVVSDNGVPAYSATNSFTVTVNDINVPPVLPAQPDVTIYGPVTLTVTNTATDTDLPPDSLTYQLTSGPAGAAIDGNGIITWSPALSQIPSTNIFTTVVTDYNSNAPVNQVLSATNSFTVIVLPAISPVLLPLPNVTINEGQSLTITNTAYDAPTVGQWSTNTFNFTYANRSAFVGAGWNFIATHPDGTPRNTEITNPADPAIMSYDQTAHPGILRLPCDVGDLWGSLNTSTNSIFRNLPTNWGTLQLTLSFAPTQSYQQTHLALYQDDDNYLQVGLAFNSGLGGEVTTVIEELGGNPDHTAVLLNSITNIHLRLDSAMTNGNVTGSYSADGTNWTAIATYNQAFTNPRLGIWAGGSPYPWTNGLPTVDLRRLDISVTNTVPTVLSYTLINPPPGATIDNNGVIHWTPSFSQGPSTNVLTTVVTDNATPPRGATNSFLVFVQEINTPPVLPVQPDRTLNGLTPVVINNSAAAPTITKTINFSYPDRSSLLADGWSFIARTATGTARNTEITDPLAGTLVSYDQVSHPGVLRIPCDTGDMWANLNNTRNTLIRPLSSNWMSMQLSLTFAPTQNFQQSHLGLYQDDDNYVEMTFGYNGGRSFGFTQETGQSPRSLNRVFVAASNAWMRLDRDLGSGNITGFYSTDGSNWSAIATVGQNLINPSLFIWAGASPGGFPNVDLISMTTIETNTALAATGGPGMTLTYMLLNAPSGATIDSSGIIRWTPTPDQAHSTNLFVTVVTDYDPLAVNAQHLSSTNSFTVIVDVVNSPPILPPQPDRAITGMTPLVVTNTATDADVPPDALTYMLLNGPPTALIDTNGVITWTPTAQQVPGSYVFTTVVTDYNPLALTNQQLSATNSFTVVVNPIHNSPVLPVQSNQVVLELATLVITNTATESDLPPLTVTYSLINPPSGASIDTNGVIAWTPNEAQGPGTNVITTVVTDSGNPSLSATNSFTVVVEEVNTPPVLPVLPNITISGSLLVTNTATDSDIPINTLTYQLAIAPAGAAIDTNGIITWTPSPGQIPSTNIFEITVMDFNPWAVNAQQLSATNSFTVVVLAARSGPSLPFQPAVEIAELTTLTVTNTASYSDIPALTLNYQLINPPAGASIDTNGIITWTPSEAQGPATNVIEIVVTDGGNPPLNATNSFTVIVDEINTPPVLPVIGTIILSGTASLVVADSGTDYDIPANALTYALTQAPAGAEISSNGIITWIPSKSEVPSSNLFAVVVTDYNPWAVNSQHLSATNSFTVIVNSIHNGPQLLAQADQTIAEMTALTVTNTAVDNDVPSLGLSYSLLGAPLGAGIDTNGVITWTPSEAQGPSTNVITTVVTDGGTPPLSATNSFTVVVLEINTAPLLPFQMDQTVNAGQTLVVTNTATDSDIPTNSLSYQLLGAPAGALIDTNGIIRWTPSPAQAPSTNVFETVVTDYNPWAITNQNLSATNSFTVIVRGASVPFNILSIVASGDSVTLTWESVIGSRYHVQYKDGLSDVWHDEAPDVTANALTTSAIEPVGSGPERYFRVINVGAGP